MAEIAPIQGLLYDPARVSISKVLAPPYDVINEAQRAELEALDPHNSVRLILPRGEGDAKYGNADEILKAWKAEGVVQRDQQPAIYRYNQIFTSKELGPDAVVRRGFIAGVRLHAFSEGVIKPHERTLRGPKEDRLKLTRATRTQFSQIFMLYPDAARAADKAVAQVEEGKPDLEGQTADGTTHQLWRITDPALQAQIARILAPMSFYIADGHHRYETLLALRDEVRAQNGTQAGSHAATEFVSAFLANRDDPGLVVLPTHRLVHSLAKFDLNELLGKARAHFEVEEVAGAAAPAEAQRLRAEIGKRAAKAPAFALVVPGKTSAWILSLRVPPAETGLAGAPALLSLDVTLLHGLVLEKLLGVDRAAQEAQTNINYIKDTADALERVHKGEAQVGFVMHPTRVQQVRDVSDAGEVMPQKSTFFYPKIASGLVMNPLIPSETLHKL
jgi:uncharacterized protein (DUF1015 family)